MAAAVAAAAAKLGLGDDQVDVEILKEPVASTFGRIGEPAQVRVTPKNPAARAASSPVIPSPVASPAAVPSPVVPSPVVPSPVVPSPVAATPRYYQEALDPEEVAADTELAGDFIEGLLDVLDIDGDITTWVDEAGGHVDVEGPKLDFLIGVDGETLAALQELTRLAVLRRTQRWSRITVDVDRYRARRREEIAALARAAADRVARSGEQEELRPMGAFERKIVHDAVAALPNLRTESLGEEPNRRVVILPT